MSNHYSTLGVSKTASKDEIKKAYRKLAMQYHPDRNPGNLEAEKKFKEISAAYDIVGDDKKRAQYDAVGDNSFHGQGFGGSTGGFHGGFGKSSGHDPFSDIFNEFFGGGRGGFHSQSQEGLSRRGANLRIEIEISLEEAFSGTKKKITIPTMVLCGKCEGSGSKTNSSPERCAVCKGSGVIINRQGFFSVQQTCSACDGEGSIIPNPCKSCSGSGRVHGNKSVSLEIHQGIDHKEVIIVHGEGEAGTIKGQTGDLEVIVKLEKHSIFTREGNDIFCEVPVSMVTACIGGEIEVPTLDGGVILKIPEGSQNGSKLRVSGRGMKTKSGFRGDMYVKIAVEIPVILTENQKNLLKQFAADSSEKKHNPKSSNFFEKVKKFCG